VNPFEIIASGMVILANPHWLRLRETIDYSGLHALGEQVFFSGLQVASEIM
jgi:hypothetical protein